MYLPGYISLQNQPHMLRYTGVALLPKWLLDLFPFYNKISASVKHNTNKFFYREPISASWGFDFDDAPGFFTLPYLYNRELGMQVHYPECLHTIAPAGQKYRYEMFTRFYTLDMVHNTHILNDDSYSPTDNLANLIYHIRLYKHLYRLRLEVLSLISTNHQLYILLFTP